MSENSRKKPISVGIIGLGKLGTAVYEEAVNNDEFYVGSIFSKRTDHPQITANLADFCNFCDVLIDCTSSGFENICDKLTKPIVIASTQPISRYPSQIPTLLLPNASSWPIIHETIVKLAKMADFHIIIHDVHGQHKKDAPSGSIRKLLANLSNTNSTTEVHSTRKFDVKGLYEITIFNETERIKISHEVFDRKSYAKGLLKAAKWLISQKPGLYTTENLFQNFAENS